MKKKKSKIFIIAEIGINHEGNVGRCKKMIKQAKDLGINAVKLQIVSPIDSYPKNTKSYKLFSKANLTDNEIEDIFNYAKKIKIKIFATCDTIKNIDKINKYNPFAFKISSGLSNNIYLLNHLIKLKKKIIISVGLLKTEEIKKILRRLNYYKNIIFMHSVSKYPTKDEELNLNSIDFLKKFLSGYKIGYSDHTKNDDAILTSISKGCLYIEKHFTYDKTRPGYDHSVSYNYEDMQKLISNISKQIKILGSNVYDDDNFQKNERKKFLRYAVAKIKIKKSNKLKIKDIKFMRVKNSKDTIQPLDIKKFLGKKLKKNIFSNQIIKINDFEKK